MLGFRHNALNFQSTLGFILQLPICGYIKIITETLKLKKYNANDSSFIFVTHRIKFTQHPFCSCHLKGIQDVMGSIY